MSNIIANKQKIVCILTITFVIGFILFFMGRTPICTCGYIAVWYGDNFGPGNSQHLADWYAFSHIIHGFIFYGLFRKLFPRLSIFKILIMAVLLEGAWELLENSPVIINRYRAVTTSAMYYGDSIVNSMADIGFMILGFFVAKRLPFWATLGLAIAMEALTTYLIRDGLTLNIIMLLHPIEAIKNWQSYK